MLITHEQNLEQGIPREYSRIPDFCPGSAQTRQRHPKDLVPHSCREQTTSTWSVRTYSVDRVQVSNIITQIRNQAKFVFRQSNQTKIVSIFNDLRRAPVLHGFREGDHVQIQHRAISLNGSRKHPMEQDLHAWNTGIGRQACSGETILHSVLDCCVSALRAVLKEDITRGLLPSALPRSLLYLIHHTVIGPSPSSIHLYSGGANTELPILAIAFWISDLDFVSL